MSGVTLEDLEERCHNRGLPVDAELAKLTKKKNKRTTKKKVVDLDAVVEGDSTAVTSEVTAVVESAPPTGTWD